MTLPAIPPIVDAPRIVSVTATPGAPVSTISVSFPVFGSQEDLEVTVAGVQLATNLWSFTSPSGPLALLPLPITDGVVTLTPPITSASGAVIVAVSGTWQPRQTIVPTAPGIPRREFEQTISTIIAGMRDLLDAINGLSAGGSGGPVTISPSAAAALANAVNSASGLLQLNGSAAIPAAIITASGILTAIGSIPLASITGLGTNVQAALAGATNAASGLLQLNSSGAVPAIPKLGVTDGSNAPAGDVGEFIQSVVGIGGSTTVTTATPTNITSISLTAGDWDVRGTFGINPLGGQVATTLQGGVSSTSVTFGDVSSTQSFIQGTSLGETAVPLPIVRLSITSTTTVYLIGQSAFTTGASTMNVFGSISARRVR